MGALLAGLGLVLAWGCDSGGREPPPVRVTPRVLACGVPAADCLAAFGALDELAGADSVSRTLYGLDPALDLGKDCADAPARAPARRPLVALLAGPAADRAPALEARGIGALALAPASLNEVIDLHQRLGALLGRERRAAILVAEMTREIGALAVRRDGRSRLRVAWILDDPGAGGRREVVGGSGILHEILELAGADNAFHTPARPRLRVSEAEIARVDPDLVLAADGTPLEIARLPILDPLSRVRELQAYLYPDDSARSRP